MQPEFNTTIALLDLLAEQEAPAEREGCDIRDHMLRLASSPQNLHRIVHFVPRGAELFGGFLPGQSACPMPQEMHVNPGRGVFPHTPRNFLDDDSALPAVDATHTVDQEDQIAPESDELKPPRRARLVVAGRGLMTARANGCGSFPWPHRNEDGVLVLGERGLPVDEPGMGWQWFKILGRRIG